MYLFTRRRSRPTGRVELHARDSIRPRRRCRASPRCPSPPAGSNARCATCSASSRSTTRCPAGWCATSTGPAAGTRCAPTPATPPAFGDVDGPYPFLTVEGPGVYEIPVGPVHAGMIEPGHFRFSVVGETILNLKARLWFVHRGIEKLFEGRTPDARRRAGRTDQRRHRRRPRPRLLPGRRGRPSVDRARRRAPASRAILLELERLYNHVTDIGALCNDVGHGILNAHAQRIREQLLRLNDDVTGHRLLRGAIHPGGGPARRLPDPAVLAAIARRRRRDRRARARPQRRARPVHRHRRPHPRSRPPTSARSATSPAPAASTIDARHDHPFADLGVPPRRPAPRPAATCWPGS